MIAPQDKPPLPSGYPALSTLLVSAWQNGISRSGYVLAIIVGIVIYACSIAIGMMLLLLFEIRSKDILSLLVILANIVGLLLFTVLTIARIRHIGFSGWLVLLLLVPIVNLFVLVCCFSLPANYRRKRQ